LRKPSALGQNPIKLGKGYSISWNGEFEIRITVHHQLKLGVVPISKSSVLIFMWLFLFYVFNSANLPELFLINFTLCLTSEGI